MIKLFERNLKRNWENFYRERKQKRKENSFVERERDYPISFISKGFYSDFYPLP